MSALVGFTFTAVPFTGASAAEPVTYREIVLGNAKAKVTVIEYASLTCPHCAHFTENDFPKLKAAYIDTGKIKFIYRDFPLDNLAAGAALIVRCAPTDRAMPLVEALFKNQDKWARVPNPLEEVTNFAQLAAGMSKADVEACLNNTAVFDQIRDVAQKAVSLYKIGGTPTFFVDEEKIEGIDFEALQSAIDKRHK